MAVRPSRSICLHGPPAAPRLSLVNTWFLVLSVSALRKHPVQTFRTHDLVVARRCRRAQYSGRIATLTLDGISVSGVFHSVREDFGTGQTQWTIAVIPKVQASFPFKQLNQMAQ